MDLVAGFGHISDMHVLLSNDVDASMHSSAQCCSVRTVVTYHQRSPAQWLPAVHRDSRATCALILLSSDSVWPASRPLRAAYCK